MSCPVPTFAANREEKNAFPDTLQRALSTVPDDECYVLPGDFNARVGSRLCVDNEWCYKRGPHGHGVLNKVRRGLLFFLV